MSYLDLTPEDINASQLDLDTPRTILGIWVRPLINH
jgi:hypothetical protein